MTHKPATTEIRTARRTLKPWPLPVNRVDLGAQLRCRTPALMAKVAAWPPATSHPIVSRVKLQMGAVRLDGSLVTSGSVVVEPGGHAVHLNEYQAMLASIEWHNSRPQPRTSFPNCALQEIILEESDLKELLRCDLEYLDELMAYSRSHLEEELGRGLISRVAAALEEAGAPPWKRRPTVPRVLGRRGQPSPT